MSDNYQAAKDWLMTAGQRADSRDRPIEMAQACATLALVDELRASREEPAFDAQDIASQMFIAYNAAGANPWRTFDGRAVPPWADLTDEVRAKWVAAARCGIAMMKMKT